jgi:membrane protease YdiL (CAAX protease family)
MTHSTAPEHTGRPLCLALAVGGVILIWLGYATLQTLSTLGHLGEGLYAALSFVPGLLGVGILLWSGRSPEACFLQIRRPSKAGLAVLAGVMVFALAAILPAGTWQGWNWTAALVYAPASGISQELFFRPALLPAMLALWKKRPTLALVAHSVLFGLWHIGPLFLGAPLWAVVAIMVVPFVSGIGWGWAVRHDKTVLWAMVQHSLIWVIGLQFAFDA